MSQHVVDTIAHTFGLGHVMGAIDRILHSYKEPSAKFCDERPSDAIAADEEPVLVEPVLKDALPRCVASSR
jgi:hypothetical protein